jgi:hypothetical protein
MNTQSGFTNFDGSPRVVDTHERVSRVVVETRGRPADHDRGRVLQGL